MSRVMSFLSRVSGGPERLLCVVRSYVPCPFPWRKCWTFREGNCESVCYLSLGGQSQSGLICRAFFTLVSGIRPVRRPLPSAPPTLPFRELLASVSCIFLLFPPSPSNAAESRGLLSYCQCLLRSFLSSQNPP